MCQSFCPSVTPLVTGVMHVCGTWEYIVIAVLQRNPSSRVDYKKAREMKDVISLAFAIQYCACQNEAGRSGTFISPFHSRRV